MINPQASGSRNRKVILDRTFSRMLGRGRNAVPESIGAARGGCCNLEKSIFQKVPDKVER